jgi:hypothetical protein
MTKWICKYCGGDTSDVDMDYLVGTDHLVCILQSDTEKKVEIENWHKLDTTEFEFRGVPFKVFGTSKVDNRYTIDIYETVNGEYFVRVDLWADNKELSLKIFPPNQFTSPPIHLDRYITKEHLKDPTMFISTVCELMVTNKEVKNILDYFRDRINSKNGKTGIVSHIMNNGTTMTFGSASIW